MAKPLVLWQSNHHLIMPRDYLEEFSTKSISLGALLYFHELILFCSKNTIFQFQFTTRLKLLVIKSILVTFTKHTLNKNKRIQLPLSPQQECYYTFITLLKTVFWNNFNKFFFIIMADRCFTKSKFFSYWNIKNLTSVKIKFSNIVLKLMRFFLKRGFNLKYSYFSNTKYNFMKWKFSLIYYSEQWWI